MEMILKTAIKAFVISFCASFTIYTTIIWGINGFELNTSNNGIYPRGSNAVYILNEVCTVNMLEDRTNEDMIADFNYCLQMHRELNDVHE